jgi:outer membrane immunogenic protein
MANDREAIRYVPNRAALFLLHCGVTVTDCAACPCEDVVKRSTWISYAEMAMTRSSWGLLLTGAPLALALGAAPALSADLPVKAQPIVKAPVLAPYSWTGWYIGANAGYGVGEGYGTYAGPAFETFNAMPAGGFGGGQLGYNYQFPSGFLGSFVIGAETDIQGAGMSDKRTCLLGCIPASFAMIDSRLNWFGTTRARVGLATGPVLSYVTGGVAYGDIETGITTPAGSVTASTTKTGWTWGAGIEAALGGNWTAKAEYLYLDFGSASAASLATGSLNVKNQEQLFRGGLNYRFGPSQPAAFGPTRNWSGLFVGGTFGAGIGRNDSTFVEPANPAAEAFFLSPRGWDAGGIAGYNWQFGNWVLGIDGDFQGSMGAGYVTNLADGTAIDQKLSWFGTARGRLGYGVGNALFYATGGAAFGEVKTSIAQGGTAGSFSHTKSGFAVGGGIENKLDLFGLLGPAWTTRTEYLYLDLGSVNDQLAGQTLTSNIHEHIWRTVVSYKFGTP